MNEKLERIVERSRKRPAESGWADLLTSMSREPPKRVYGKDEDLSYFPGQCEYHGYVPCRYEPRAERKAA